MAETVSWEGLRELAEFQAEKGCAISLYVDLDPSTAPTAGDADTRVSSLLTEGERRAEANSRGLTHEQRVALKKDFARIRDFFENDFDRDGAHGLAVFTAALDNVWRPRALIESVPDGVRVGREFHLAPLVPLVGRGEGALVAVVGRERGGLYRLRSGRLDEVADRSDEVPGKHDQGGWSQARFQRHIEKLVGEHLREVAEELDRRVRKMRSPKLIIVSSEETRAELEELLAKDTKSAVIGWTSAEAHAGPSELLELTSPFLEEARVREEAQVVERWRERQVAAVEPPPGGARRWRPRPTRGSTCSSTKRTRSTRPGSARRADGSRHPRGSARSTAPRRSIATTVSTQRCTRRSPTAGRSGGSANVVTSSRSEASGRSSASEQCASLP